MIGYSHVMENIIGTGMRKVLAALSLGAAFQVHAEPSTRAERLEACKADSELARTIMDARQAGVRMSDVMDHVAGDSVSEQIVEMAYARSRYQNDEIRERATVDFENDVYATCIKGAPRK